MFAKNYLPLSEKPLVSVILPTYNRSELLPQSIDSVLSQSYANVELIVVDDGSTDDTEAVVRACSPAIRYVRQPHTGVAAARNRGLIEARGELIAFQDSDDLWRPGKLDRQVELMQQRPNAGMVYTSHRITDLAGNVIGGRWKQLHSGCVTDALFQTMFVIMPSTVVRRTVVQRVGQFNTALRINSDYEYWLRASLVTEFAAIDESLVDERQSPNRLTSARAEAATLQYEMLVKFYWDQGGRAAIRPETARRALAKSAWSAARALRDNGLPEAASAMFATSLRHQYTFRAAWGGFRLGCRRLVHVLAPAGAEKRRPAVTQPGRKAA